MILKYKKYLFTVFIFSSLTFSATNEIQLVTTHKKSNGTLLRIVTSRIMDIQDIAGWARRDAYRRNAARC